MVKLSLDMITKSAPGQNKRRSDESISHYLNRLTHIYFQDKSITEIDSISTCKNLTVIYLYDNNLAKIENLEFAPNLTHLYLQNNKIKRMENLSNLKMLTKLHIGGNRIKLIEGLENLTDLEELNVENQILPLGEKLLFEPRTLLALSNNLKVLNVSGNNLDSLSELGSLVNLEQLFASNNNLADMKEMSFLFKCWPRLWKLELNGNLLCLKNKYRERIIVLAPNLESLDGKEIQEMSRQFLQNWKNSKEVSRGKQEPISQPESLANQPVENFKLSNQPSSSELPRINNMNSMPTYVMPEGYQIVVPAAEYRKRQMILYPKQKNNLKMKSDEMNGNSLGYTSYFNYNMTTSLQSIIPSSVKTNGFMNRGNNMSAKHKSMRNTNATNFIEELRNNYQNGSISNHPLNSVSALTSNKIGFKFEMTNPLSDLIFVPPTQASEEKKEFFQIELDREEISDSDLKKIGEFIVYDENGNRHQMANLSAEFKTVFVFIRSMLCFTSAEYVEGKSGSSIHVKSSNWKGLLNSCKRAIYTSEVFDYQGRFDQQGGCLIVGPGPVFRFFSRDENAHDHTPINQILKEININPIFPLFQVV